jgi:hypothetical protein
MKLVKGIDECVDMKQGKDGKQGAQETDYRWGTEKGEKKNVKKGGNWIVRLNLFASSC